MGPADPASQPTPPGRPRPNADPLSGHQEIMHSPRIYLTVLSLLMVGWPPSAKACCASDPGFVEIARHASIVVIGRVVALPPETRDVTSAPPEFVDVRVMRVRRGEDLPPIIRVWDGDAYSSVGGGLKGMRVGLDVAIAAESVADERERQEEARSRGEMAYGRLPPGGYMIRGCATYWKQLRTSALGR